MTVTSMPRPNVIGPGAGMRRVTGFDCDRAHAFDLALCWPGRRRVAVQGEQSRAARARPAAGSVSSSDR